MHSLTALPECLEVLPALYPLVHQHAHKSARQAKEIQQEKNVKQWQRMTWEIQDSRYAIE